MYTHSFHMLYFNSINVKCIFLSTGYSCLKEWSNTAPINVPQSSHIVAMSAVQETGTAEQVSSFTTQQMYPVPRTSSTQCVNPMGCERSDSGCETCSSDYPTTPDTGDISAVQIDKKMFLLQNIACRSHIPKTVSNSGTHV